MNPEGFEYSALVPGRGIVVLELLQPGSFGMGGAFVDVKTFAGVVGNGVNDDSAGIQLALDTVAGSGVALWFSAGTYKTTSPLVLKSDTLVWGSPDARIECALATVGPQDALFLAPPPATVSTTTLANPPLLTTAGSNQFDTVASIAPGTTINVERAVNFDFEYITRAVSGVGPFTITLDRPMVRVFAAGDVVTRQAAGQVRNVRMYGNGMSLSGTCARIFEFLEARDCFVSDFRIDADAGAWVDTAFSWDTGSYNCVYERMQVRGNSSCGFGSTLESCEACGWRDSEVSGLTSTVAFEALQATDCFAENIRASLCSTGVRLTSGVGGVNTSNMRVTGATILSCVTGISIDFCDRLFAEALDVRFCSQFGVETTANMGVGNCLSGRSTGNTAGGLIVTAGGASLQIGDLNVSDQATGATIRAPVVATSLVARRCATLGLELLAGAGGSSLGIVDVSDCATIGFAPSVDCVVDEFIANNTVGSGGNLAVLAGTPIVQVRAASVVQNPPGGGAIGTFYLGVAGRLIIDGASVVMRSNVTAFQTAAAGAVLELSNCTAKPFGGATGTKGIDLVAASTVRIGEDVDVDACATPTTFAAASFPSRGTFNLSGGGATTVAFPDLKSTDNVKLTLFVKAGTGTGLSPVIVETLATGFTAAGVAGDTSTWAYEIS